MNTEKLDDLASQAGFDVAHLRAPHPGGFPREDMLALESFAELIVRECIDIISPYAVKMENFDGGHPIADLKKHFGVEE